MIHSINHTPPPVVLLVEDDPLAQKLHQRFLKMLGCQVTLIDTAQAAINASVQTHYDAVLLDFHLPDKNGDAVIQAILAREQATQMTKSLPIIVMSADAQQPQLQACLDLGACQIHEKPISLSVLGRALQDCGIVVDILRDHHTKLAHQSYLEKLGFQDQSSAKKPSININ